MNPTKLKLTNPTDDELSAAVAEYVAGCVIVDKEPAMTANPVPTCVRYDGKLLWVEWDKPLDDDPKYWCGELRPLKFATSADAVLPLLEKHDAIITHSVKERDWRVVIEGGRCNSAPTFPRAACIALCRANGIEVEHPTPPNPLAQVAELR